MSYGFTRSYDTPRSRDDSRSVSSVSIMPSASSSRRGTSGDGSGSGSSGGGGARSRTQDLEVVVDGATPGSLYFSVGGGLSPSRIVKKVQATDYVNGTLSTLVEYALSHLENDEERMISQTIGSRREHTDYMVCINRGSVRPNNYLEQTVVSTVAVQRRIGEVEFPYIDIAIVSAEEGGKGF